MMLTNILSHRRPAAILAATGIASLAVFLARPAVAHAAGVEDETAFVFNTFSFLVWGALVMWMCAGFTMLESGSVRTKNASMICLKNIGLYSIAGLAYFFIGYNLMYVGVGREVGILGIDFGNLIGSFNILYGPSGDEIALLAGEDGALTKVLQDGAGYSVMSDWFFQMVFVATAASIVSGTLAERVKMWSFLLFTLLLTAFIYPIVGAWTWGGGWLSDLGFQDFAGSTIVHSTGGWAALAGMLVVGPRLGKFRRDGTVRPTPPSNILLVTLGVFILWFGWFGFNGGSQLALASAADAVSMSIVLVNTNLAAAAGVMAASSSPGPSWEGRPVCRTEWRNRRARFDHRRAHFGGPHLGRDYRRDRQHSVRRRPQTPREIKLDDVVGAVPAHLFAGIWGTLAASIAAGATFHIQLLA